VSTVKRSFAVAGVLLSIMAGTGIPVTTQGSATDPFRTAIDADHDGVADRRDPCPFTPPKSRAVSEGCSALDLVATPEAVLDPALKELTAVSEALDTRRFAELAAVETMLSASRAEFATAREELAQAEMCQAAATAHRAVTRLTEARDRVSDIVPLLQKRTMEEASRSPGVEYGDAGPYDIVWHELRAADSAAREASARLDTTVRTLDGACAAVVGPLAIKGRVVETDDANRRIRFDNGTVVGIPATQGFDIARGNQLSAAGVSFADGTGVVTSLGDGPVSKPALLLPCMALLVAPLQSAFFTSPVSGYTLHPAKGYLQDGYLRLEAGTQLAVRDLSCPTAATTPGGFWRYSMKIVATYKKTPSGATLQEVIGTDVADGEAVSFPAQAALDTVVTLLTTIRRQQCIFLPSGNQCGQIEKASGPSYKIVLSRRGAFCRAVGTNVVALDDDPATLDFREHQISSVETSGIPSPFYAFEAEGYAVTNDTSSRPQVKSIQLKQHYAVYDDDFGDDDLFSADINGVTARAALRWPRIKGIHDGEPFWYTCEVQAIVRDAVELCLQAPHAFYKLPWSGVAKTTQGNYGGLTHSGLWAFAFDFVMNQFDPIYATRGGTVTTVTEDLYKNSNPYLVKAKLIPAEPANAIQIRHQDGTYSWYFHMIQNSVIPEVGDVVKRGDLLAMVGMTGNATGPHLHYEVNRTEGSQDQTVQIRFQAKTWLGAQLSPCHIPVKGEYLLSTQ
jgi:murein DD-endopeptidase MepM/ murein hydrolase activator NlpD